MYEDEPNKTDGTHSLEKDRVLAWTKDVAKSIAEEAPRSTAQAPAPHSKARHVEHETPRVVVNQIVTTPAVIVTRFRPEPTPQDEISTKAVIGTVLGATAGAIVAYAMTKSQTETPPGEQHEKVACRTIEAPVTYELVQSDGHVRAHSGANSKSSHYSTAAPPLSRPYIENPNPQSEHSHHVFQSFPSFPQSHVKRVTNPADATKISVAGSGSLRASRVSSHGKTTQPDLVSITEMRSAKDMPLPHSHVTSLAVEEGGKSKVGKSLVSPKESVSQVSTRKSGESGRRKYYGGRSRGSKKDYEHGYHRSRTSKS